MAKIADPAPSYRDAYSEQVVATSEWIGELTLDRAYVERALQARLRWFYDNGAQRRRIYHPPGPTTRVS